MPSQTSIRHSSLWCSLYPHTHSATTHPSVVWTYKSRAWENAATANSLWLKCEVMKPSVWDLQPHTLRLPGGRDVFVDNLFSSTTIRHYSDSKHRLWKWTGRERQWCLMVCSHSTRICISSKKCERRLPAILLYCIAKQQVVKLWGMGKLNRGEEGEMRGKNIPWGKRDRCMPVFLKRREVSCG